MEVIEAAEGPSDSALCKVQAVSLYFETKAAVKVIEASSGLIRSLRPLSSSELFRLLNLTS